MTFRCDRYVLDGDSHEPEPCPDLFVWGEWMQHARRDVGDTTLWTMIDRRPVSIRISTVFLGLDHNIYDDGAPILFETMIFGGPNDGDQKRYRTWDEAAAGHQEWVEQQRAWLGIDEDVE